jgi:hypothetical protein
MLSINSLHDELLERQNKKNRIYEDVLEKIIIKIKYVNSRTNDCFLVYTLKNFIFGIPLYNIRECGNYLQKRLSDAGFYCKYNQLNNIFISWKSRPTKEKILISHQYTQPQTTSIAYPSSANIGTLALTNEPNMLKMKPNPKKQNGIVSKQKQFSELDQQFLNMDIGGTSTSSMYSDAFSHNVVNEIQPTRHMIQPNFHQGNQLFKNDNNIKEINYNNGKNKNGNRYGNGNRYKNGIKNNSSVNSGVSSSEANSLDEFLGTLI